MGSAESIFDAAGEQLHEPGHAGGQELLEAYEFQVTVGQIADIYAVLGWSASKSPSKEEFTELVARVNVDQASNHGDEEDSEELARLIDTIAERLEGKKFPPVLPEELGESDEQISAKDTLQYFMKVETVEMQSYHDDQYAKFRKSNPGDGDMSERERRAKFARDTFYPLTIKFYIEKALVSHQFRHRMVEGFFLPLIPVASIGDLSKRKEADQLVSEMKEEFIPSFDTKLWSKWEVVLKYSSYLQDKVEVSLEL